MDSFRRANRPLYNTHLSTSIETMTRISNCCFCTLGMVSKASVIQIWTVAKRNFRAYLLLIDHLPHASIPFWLACDRKLYELCLAEAFSTNMLQGLWVLRGMLNSGPLHLGLCQSVLQQNQTLLFYVVSCLCPDQLAPETILDSVVMPSARPLAFSKQQGFIKI